MATLDELPILKLLPADARALVVNSFVPASFPFGRVIVREADAADAMYVILSGQARVLKSGDDGEEIPLNVLGPGDTFGDIEMLDDRPRPATVRASSDVAVLRLDRSVFEALLRVHPDIRVYFELQDRYRTLRNFFRRVPAFGRLPGEAVAAIVLAEIEPVASSLDSSSCARANPRVPSI